MASLSPWPGWNRPGRRTPSRGLGFTRCCRKTGSFSASTKRYASSPRKLARGKQRSKMIRQDFTAGSSRAKLLEPIAGAHTHEMHLIAEFGPIAVATGKRDAAVIGVEIFAARDEM